ncbi:MAG TPA: hypothetical protein VHR86_06140 [Armatimonadota bacterium]|nr:hypothetical protein [Armatimonadota bacterium]
MSEQTGSFLSAATIRRMLELHPFSEANQAYLRQEADRREQREKEMDNLMREVASAAEEPVVTPKTPRGMVGADTTTSAA